MKIVAKLLRETIVVYLLLVEFRLSSACLDIINLVRVLIILQAFSPLVLFKRCFNTIDQLQRSPLLKKLNYFMLLAKYYLYNQKLNQIEPELNEFKNRPNFQYRVEKLV